MEVVHDSLLTPDPPKVLSRRKSMVVIDIVGVRKSFEVWCRPESYTDNI
jgi:hypothetical protein